METLGDRIRHFRKLKGLSQKRLAELSGVRQATIAELELNNQKSTKRLLEIAKGLGVAVTDLAPDMKELLDAVHGERDINPPPALAESQKHAQVHDDGTIVVGDDLPASPKDRSLKEHVRQLRADSVRLEQAIAVVEGTMLAAGLKPEYLGALREIIYEALESPLVLSNPDAELDARRALAQSNVSRLLRKRGVLADKE